MRFEIENIKYNNYKFSNILSSEVEGQNPPIVALAARG